MNPLFAAACDVQAFCHRQGWRFCIIGGLAVQRWGEPRFTRDVDCAILTGFGQELVYIDELLRHFTGRLENARDFALANRVLLLANRSGVPIDISLGALPFEARVIERASLYNVSDTAAFATCSAEDLIILKAFAGRDRDWADIEGIVQRQAGRLDQDLVWRELAPLLELKEEAPVDAADKLRRLFRSARS